MDQKLFEQVAAHAPRGAIAVIRGREGVPVEHLCWGFRKLGRQVVVVDERYPSLHGAKLCHSLEEAECRWHELAYGGLASISVDIEGDGSFEQKVSEIIYSAQLDRANRRGRYPQLARNVLANLDQMRKPTLMTARGVYDGLPAFIVGSGPSLEAHRHLCGEMKKRGLVIAVNSAGQALTEPPHMALCVEADDITPLMGDTRGVPVAHCLSGNPAMFEYPNSFPIWTCPASGVARDLVDEPFLRTIISASGAAIELARRMGCSPIVLVGQDLSYPGGKLYADATGGGTLDGETPVWGERHRSLKRIMSPLPTKMETFDWPGIDGQPVQTTKQWAVLLRWLTLIAKHEGVVGVNASAQGAMIDRWWQRDLSELLPTMPERDVPDPAKVLRAQPKPDLRSYSDWAADVEIRKRVAAQKAELFQYMANWEEQSPTHSLVLRDVSECLRRTSPVLWYLACEGTVDAVDRYLMAPPQGDAAKEYREELEVIRNMCQEVINAYQAIK